MRLVCVSNGVTEVKGIAMKLDIYSTVRPYSYYYCNTSCGFSPSVLRTVHVLSLNEKNRQTWNASPDIGTYFKYPYCMILL
jgi:hypothetical protein